MLGLRTAVRPENATRTLCLLKTLSARRYFDPPTSTWIEGVTHGSTSYSILRFGSAGADWFCFAGLAGNGDFVLERWKLKPKGGRVPPPPYPLLKISDQALQRLDERVLVGGFILSRGRHDDHDQGESKSCDEVLHGGPSVSTAGE